jgi:PXPV repeat (3 copies)
MKRLLSAKSIAVAALALGAVGAASAAHARSDVFFSIGVPGAYVSNAPVYVQPEPVYVQPQPVYVAPPVYRYEQPAYYNNGYYGNGARYVYERDHRRYWRHEHRFGPYGDRDHDGVPNRFDRAPGNPYRR